MGQSSVREGHGTLWWLVVVTPVLPAAGLVATRSAGESVKRSLMRLMGKGHVWLYRKTGGRFVSMGGTVLILTTTGARSGLERSCPVAGYQHGEGWIVVAAAGGERNPGWYHNLLVHPDVLVERGSEVHRMVAREVQGEERAALWDEVVEAESGFASMQRRRERIFPVMILEPAGSDDSMKSSSVATAHGV